MSTSSAEADRDTHGTVLVAMGANLAIGVAKGVAAAVTGSPAMLSEAAHSVADTVNEVFVLASLSRSRRKADAAHPFGYGKERFFWSLLAALGIFVTGACFSFYQGARTLVGKVEPTGHHPAVAYVVLALAFVAEGTSLVRARCQIASSARAAGRTVRQQLRIDPEPTVRRVFVEDFTAVIGVALALAGLVLHHLTGSARWEAAASFGIAGLLAYAAYLLGRNSRELLIGQSAEPRDRLAALDFLEQQAEIEVVLEVLTMRLSPTATLFAARIDPSDGLDSDRVEEVSGSIKMALAAAHPQFQPVFLDITDATDANTVEARRRWQELRREVDTDSL